MGGETRALPFPSPFPLPLPPHSSRLFQLINKHTTLYEEVTGRGETPGYAAAAALVRGGGGGGGAGRPPRAPPACARGSPAPSWARAGHVPRPPPWRPGAC